MDIVSYILSRQFTKQSLIGMGALKGSPCQVKDIVHQDGINTVTFEWEGTDGTKKTRDMVVYDGTPIYVWESGNTYHYGDLAIYESQFYRCIVENNDVTFDSTKWNEIGSPDGNYDIVQSVSLLPARFTAADRKLYYVIDENCFYLWNGTAWVKTISNKIADLDDVNLDDLAEGDVLVWDSVNEKWVNKAKFDEYKTAFTGTEEEWNALTSEEQNVYDIINITNDGDVLNLGIYLEKTTAMPVASEDEENKIYLYTGTTTQNYKKGVVYQCVSDGQTPATYSWIALIDFGTASIKNSTDRVLPNSTDLVESRAVYSAINTALSSIYTPRGNITCAELTSALLISDNIGSVYETSDSGTTTALFLQGAGHPIAVGSNIGIINAGQDRILFNLMPNAFDLTDYQKKDLASTIEGATTVEGALGVLSTKKVSKVSSATNGNFAGLDASGNLTDSGKKPSDFQTALTFDDAPTENSNNPVKSGGVYAVKQTFTKYVNEYGSKNLCPYEDTWSVPTTNTAGRLLASVELKAGDKITFVCTQNNAMTSNVRNTLIIDNPSGVRSVQSASTNNHLSAGLHVMEYTATENGVHKFGIWANTISTATTYSKFMICYTDVYNLDSTYEPYSKTNLQLTQDSVTWDDLSEVGAVNFLNHTATNLVQNGITFTVNADRSITANGTATAEEWVRIAQNVAVSESVRASGCPKGGTPSTYFMTFSQGDNSYRDYGDGVIVPSGTIDNVYMVIKPNATVDIVFKPMIAPVSYNGDYVPYAKTNRQLTQDTTGLIDNMMENGAVNYIYPIDSTKTDSAGVTWTLNSDNSVSVSSGGISPSTGTGFSYRNNNAAFLRGKTVTFKANVTGNTPTYDKLYFAVICRETESGANLVRYELWPTVGQTEVTFTVPDNTNYVIIGCNIQNGATTAIDCKISPIVSLASYNGSYVPYAKTNKELSSQMQTLESDISDIETAIANNVLYFTSQACSALTGDFCTVSNAKITANHVVAEVIFANPSAITTDVTWTTASGSLKLNGTCSTATTVNIVLVKKTN